MKIKKFTINICKDKDKDKENNIVQQKINICETCRKKYLGYYDNNGDCITWKKISINNCYC